MRIGKHLAVGAACLSVALLAGCAVLRIDVDVYKGPLANHRDVQQSQLWSMTVAAYPLLTELRDTIEWDRNCARFSEYLIPKHFNNDDRRRSEVYELCIVWNRDYSSDWYQASAISIEADQKGYGQTVTLASSANAGTKPDGAPINQDAAQAETGAPPQTPATLDTIQEDVKRLLDEVAKLREDLEAMRKEIQSGQLQEAKVKRSHELIAELSHLSVKLHQYNLSGAGGELLELFLGAKHEQPPLLKYNIGFREYQAQRVNAILALYDDVGDADDVLTVAGVGKDQGVANNADENTGNPGTGENARNNDAASQTGNTSNGQPDGIDPEERIKAARQAWHENIEALQSAYYSGWTNDPKLDRYWRDLATSIAKRTNFVVLSKAATSRKFRYDYDIFGELLTDYLPRYRESVRDWPRDGDNLDKEGFEAMTEALTEAIRRAPGMYLSSLLQLDRQVRAIDEADGAFGEDSRVASLSGLVWPSAEVVVRLRNQWLSTYASTQSASGTQDVPTLEGLTKALINSSDDVQEDDETTAAPLKVAKATEKVRRSLDKGRLPKGIHSLSEEYLLTKKTFDETCPTYSAPALGEDPKPETACDKLHRKVQGKERVMTDSLVRFAEKILTIANNDNLFRSKNGGNAEISDFGQKQLNRFVIVLQSVGNAILVQADELRRQAAYDASIRDPAARLGEIAEIRERFTGECTPVKPVTLENGDDKKTGEKKTPDASRGDSQNAKDAASGDTPEKSPATPVTTAPGSPPPGDNQAAAQQSGGEAQQAGGEAAKPDDAAKKPDDTEEKTEQKDELACADGNGFRVHGLEIDNANIKTTMDAIDRLISALQHEKTKAALEFPGESSKVCNPETYKSDPAKSMPKECLRLKQVTDALNLVYQQRSGMVYIRPPGAYLRTSFAATNLQGDPGLSWQNMLQGQAKRSLPWYEGFKKLEEGSEGQIKAEIDKRFWQNINSVRVSGTGRTDFVLVKDDIGNWYVKGVSGNPKDVYSAAQSLTLFGMGGKIGTNLLLRRNLERDLLKAQDEAERSRIREELAKLPTADGGSGSAISRDAADILDTFTASYVKGSDEAFKNAAETVTHADYTAYIARQITDVTSGADAADQAALRGALANVQTATTVQSVYTDKIAPKLTLPDPAPDPDLELAQKQSADMIAAAKSLIDAAAAAEAELASRDLAAAVTGADTLAGLKSQKAEAEVAIKVQQAALDKAMAQQEALDAVLQKDGDNASDAIKTRHQEAVDMVNQVRAEMLRLINQRDTAQAGIADIETRMAKASEIKSRFGARLRGYFRGKIELIYASKKALNDQLNTVVGVLSKQDAPSSP
ncbi:MAG: hypothetical protein JJ855_04230 [Rhodospirillales bacterium]|nr:hypothetical protein [Rhodospirillales bacterium]